MKMIAYLYGGMLLISIALIYFAYKHYYSTKELINQEVKTTARVIDLIEISGDEITFKSEVSSSPAPYKIGDSVQIIYSRGGDEKRVVSFWGLYRWTIILLAIASPLLIIGGGYFLYTNEYI